MTLLKYYQLPLQLILCIVTLQSGVDSSSKLNLKHTLEQKESDGIKVKVDVYYEALCPDSRSFIVRQLDQAWEEIPNLFFINYIPYGKAFTWYDEEKKTYTFRCQHGPRECEGNKVHCCANNHIEDPNIKFQYIRCMMEDNYNPTNAAKRCAREYSEVNVDRILKCAEGKEGDELLAHAGQLNSKLRPKMTFVPTIELSNDVKSNVRTLYNLKSDICKLYQGRRPGSCFA
eukprot:TRINITY_DN11163_c0_g1_i2.p1 TRINITY_DN11163_c0_g1~~TRINITY_DN11163_c0_g1_i2.p1  ORF type:complete len:230 (-),score=-4.80 TRINITY_DN11163_c0_g1_i2:142-831(-)